MRFKSVGSIGYFRTNVREVDIHTSLRLLCKKSELWDHLMVNECLFYYGFNFFKYRIFFMNGCCKV
jgi:hypothetical protein